MLECLHEKRPHHNVKLKALLLHGGDAQVMTFFSCFFILLQSKIFNQETPQVFGASNLKLYIYMYK